jgi:hypothetical protein
MEAMMLERYDLLAARGSAVIVAPRRGPAPPPWTSPHPSAPWRCRGNRSDFIDDLVPPHWAKLDPAQGLRAPRDPE